MGFYDDDFFEKDNSSTSAVEESVNKIKAKASPKNNKVSFVTGLIASAFVLIFTIVLICNSIYFTKETQNAVVTTFGSAKTVQSAGMKFKIPLIQKVTKVDMSSRGMAIGYTVEGDQTIPDEASMITKDFNFLDVYFYLEYRVSDAKKFLFNSENPELILSNLAQSAIRDTVGSYGVDETLTTSRNEIEEKVKEVLIKSLEEADIGIKIDNATIQDVDTPTADVQAAFDNVETVKQNATEAINDANTYKEEQIPKAEAEADQLLQEANGKKEARINEAQGQVTRFNSLYEEYKNAPEATKLRMYYEVMEQVFPNMKVIITDSNGQVINVLNQTEKTSDTKTSDTKTSN